MITKRTFLRGLFAAPAIVAASSLMQIRGVSLIRPEELNTAELIAILNGRLDAGAGGFDEQTQRWVNSKYDGWGPEAFLRQTPSLLRPANTIV